MQGAGLEGSQKAPSSARKQQGLPHAARKQALQEGEGGQGPGFPLRRPSRW